MANESAKKHELEEKSRIDDLWASFKQDTTSLHPKSKGKVFFYQNFLNLTLILVCHDHHRTLLLKPHPQRS